MYALIPALLRELEAEARLHRTLSRLAPEITLVLVTQGDYLTRPLPARFRGLIHRHSDVPLGKWPAVRLGLNSIPRDSDSPLLLIDGDDPVAADSIRAMVSAADSGVDFAIGDRDRIQLHAAGTTEPEARTFLEVFTNTLLLLTLGGAIRKIGPDIQSGLYVLSERARRLLSLEYVRDYGGELSLFFELSRAGFEYSTVPVTTNPATPSSYSVQKIIQSIARLPFTSGVSSDQMDRALELAPTLYARYLPVEHRSRFTSAVSALLPAFSRRT